MAARRVFEPLATRSWRGTKCFLEIVWPVTFAEVPWAVAVAGDYADLGGQVIGPCRDNVGGLTHFWEYGQWLAPLTDAERIRDHLLCAVYGTFANAKRRAPVQNANLELEFLGHVPAGGESRRLLGDYLLTENDIRAQRSFPDAVATQRGHFCLHFPGDRHDFRLGDWKWIAVPPYSVPFRCLYSRNVDNLLMAGKHISVTLDQGKDRDEADCDVAGIDAVLSSGTGLVR